jgi:hypothetical protein
MSNSLVVLLVLVAVMSALPAWLCGSILKKSAAQDGGAGSDWIPFSLLPYGFSRFRHPHKSAILWGYVFSNVILVASVITLVVVLRHR